MLRRSYDAILAYYSFDTPKISSTKWPHYKSFFEDHMVYRMNVIVRCAQALNYYWRAYFDQLQGSSSHSLILTSPIFSRFSSFFFGTIKSALCFETNLNPKISSHRKFGVNRSDCFWQLLLLLIDLSCKKLNNSKKKGKLEITKKKGPWPGADHFQAREGEEEGEGEREKEEDSGELEERQGRISAAEPRGRPGEARKQSEAQ
jgi:hypothetical protein